MAFFEALASPVRIRIIELLAESDLNIKDLSEKVGITSPIMLKHVRKLEESGLLRTTVVYKNGAHHKMCTLLETFYRVVLPIRAQEQTYSYEVSIPVGHFTDVQPYPTCGLALEDKVLGALDDPAYFMDPGRVNAQLIWFSSGYVEYRIPNYVSGRKEIMEIELSCEIASEAPGYKDDWPSEISVSICGIHLCKWISPGDFGEIRGIMTPGWWQGNQYGQLKKITINHTGTSIDGALVSPVKLSDIPRLASSSWGLRFTAGRTLGETGGLSIFGEKFGNYKQDINVRVFYL